MTILPGLYSVFVELLDVYTVAPESDPQQLLELVAANLAGADYRFAEVRISLLRAAVADPEYVTSSVW